jgi:hypothetical protein
MSFINQENWRVPPCDTLLMLVIVILASKKNKYIITALIVTMPFGGSKHIEKRGNVTMSFGVVQVD